MAHTSNDSHQLSSTATRNLEQAAEIEKATDWVLARLIASSVEIGAGHGGDRSKMSPGHLAGAKLGIAPAASILSKSHNTIRAYLKAWDAAAADGHCKPSSDLAPKDGWTADLPEAHLWERYRNPNSHSTPARTTAIPADPAEAITTWTPAQKAETARALLAEPTVATEVMADTKSAANVSYASQRVWEQREARAEQQDRDQLGGLAKRSTEAVRQAEFQYALVKATKALHDAAKAMVGTDLTPDERDQARIEIARARSGIEWVESHLNSNSKSLDDELAELLGGAR